MKRDVCVIWSLVFPNRVILVILKSGYREDTQDKSFPTPEKCIHFISFPLVKEDLHLMCFNYSCTQGIKREYSSKLEAKMKINWVNATKKELNVIQTLLREHWVCFGNDVPPQRQTVSRRNINCLTAVPLSVVIPFPHCRQYNMASSLKGVPLLKREQRDLEGPVYCCNMVCLNRCRN